MQIEKNIVVKPLDFDVKTNFDVCFNKTIDY